MDHFEPRHTTLTSVHSSRYRTLLTTRQPPFTAPPASLASRQVTDPDLQEYDLACLVTLATALATVVPNVLHNVACSVARTTLRLTFRMNLRLPSSGGIARGVFLGLDALVHTGARNPLEIASCKGGCANCPKPHEVIILFTIPRGDHLVHLFAFLTPDIKVNCQVRPKVLHTTLLITLTAANSMSDRAGLLASSVFPLCSTEYQASVMVTPPMCTAVFVAATLCTSSLALKTARVRADYMGIVLAAASCALIVIKSVFRNARANITVHPVRMPESQIQALAYSAATRQSSGTAWVSSCAQRFYKASCSPVSRGARVPIYSVSDRTSAEVQRLTAEATLLPTGALTELSPVTMTLAVVAAEGFSFVWHDGVLHGLPEISGLIHHPVDQLRSRNILRTAKFRSSDMPFRQISWPAVRLTTVAA